jgi:polar amino acid transport system substrate-binding protein
VTIAFILKQDCSTIYLLIFLDLRSWVMRLLSSLLRGVVAVASAVLMVGQSGAAELVRAGELSIGSDLTYPPYAFLEGGKPAGFDAEFMQAVASELKLQTKFLDTRFANLILGVNAHRFDVVASALYVTPERAQQVGFLPYFTTGSSLVVSSKSDWRPVVPADLCGKRVASIKGASWIPKLAEVSAKHCVPAGQPAIDVREFPTSPEAAQALLAAAVDAQFEDAAVAKITVDKLKGRLAISSRELIYSVVVGLAVARDNPALLSRLEVAVAALKADGRYAALLARYNLTEPSEPQIKAALGR